MSRKLPLLAALLAAPLPAFAGGDSASLVIGGAGLFTLICIGLVVAKRPIGLAVTAVFGVVVAAYLTVQHSSTGESLCNINSTYNCDLVNRSSYSALFDGKLPVALLGLGYFAAMAWLGVRLAMGSAPKAPVVLALLAGLGLAFDGYLAWASMQLNAVCPMCVVTWTLNIVLLVGAVLEWRAGSPQAAIGESVSAEIGGVAVVGLVALVGGGLLGGNPNSQAAVNAALDEDLSIAYEQVNGTVETDGTEPVKGPADAKFTFVEWADFECPHCAAMFGEMEKLLDENKDVRLLYKHYPISGICNQFVEGERHQFACNAAAASECARLQGKFWDLAGPMFKNQQFLGKDDIRFMVEKAGMDTTQFETCMQDPSTSEAVKQDIAAGGKANINGTPSIFVKGLFPDKWVRLTLAGGREGIEKVLAAARAGKPLPPPRPPAPE
jgi:protein-disulfide isomerase